MKKIKFLFSAATVFILGTAAFSQTASNNAFFRDYVTRTWTAREGLPGNSITDCIQSKDGYLYLGTYEGLVRFDGIEFEIINKSTSDDLNFVSARAVFEDSRGNIWIGSNDEGVTVCISDHSYLNLTTEHGLPNNSIRSICEDFDGNIWIGTSSGLCCISKDYKIFVPEGVKKFPKGNKYLINSLYCDTAGRIWIISEDSDQTYIYENGSFRVFDSLKSFKDSNITMVAQEKSGVFWFGIEPHYAVRFDSGRETVYDVGTWGNQKGTKINSIYQDSQKNIWFALDSGVTILHDKELFYFTQEEGLNDEKVTKIMEDTEGNIWICTDRGGIEKFSAAKFETIALKSSVNAIAYDSIRNVMWFAADNGLYCFKDNDFVENEVTDFCKNIRIRHVEMDGLGNLLISAYDKLGQIVVSPEGKIRNWTKADGLTGNKIRVGKRASDGKIYVGATTGLSVIEEDSGKILNITKDVGIENDYIMCITERSNGEIWCGTDGGGIFVIDDGAIVKTFSSENGLAGNIVFKIIEFSENELWITTGSGISRYKDGKFSNITSKNGLGTDSVFQLIPDFSSNVWITSNKGICSVKKHELDAVADGKSRKLVPKYFGSEDGIISGGATSTSLSAVDNVGRIWFTLIDGVSVYDPIRVSSNNQAPVVQVKSVILDSEKIEYRDKTIVAKPGVKRISINYTGISFVSSEQVTFKTMLEGFDKTFSEWTTERSVSYTNLKPGTYKFYVIAQNSDDFLGQPISAVTIVKRAAFYEAWYFWVLIVVAVIFSFVYVIFNRLHLIKEKQRNMEILAVEREKSILQITKVIVGSIDAKDPYTNGHSLRVAEYSRMLAERLGQSEEECEKIYYAGLLHDVGKIGVLDTILCKPGKLTDEEYAEIKKHSEIGGDILKDVSSIPYARTGARWHHERFDGKGYPDGLTGNEIPFVARIICVADSYDAMTSTRSYRTFMPQAKVRSEFERCNGTQFDPEIAAEMIKLIDEDKNYLMHE